MNNPNHPSDFQGRAHEPEYCTYNTRNFKVDLKKRLKVLAIESKTSLETMLNIACEIGVEYLEKQQRGII